MGFAIAKNKIKTGIIVGVIAVLLYLLVYFVADSMGYGNYAVVIAGVISIGTSLLSYWNSAKIALASNGAKKATGNDEAYIRSVVSGICTEAGLPMPELYVIEDNSPNAFATGRNPSHSAVAVTRGLLNTLDQDELRGVLAHEVGHIKNYDILLQTVASIMVGAIIIISDIFSRSLLWGGGRRRSDRNSGNGILAIIGLVLMIFAPIAGQLLRMCLSRNREYLADATAADLTGRPEALASALLKISGNPTPVMLANKATEGMYISDPMKKLSNLFSTHPPIEKRVEALYNMR